MAETGPSQAPERKADAPLPASKRSPWPLATAMKAMEKTLCSQASRLKSLEGRAGAVEKKLSDCERSAAEFGSRLDSKRAALESVVQEYGQLQRRLENMENLLRNRNFWLLRLPPGRRGGAPRICDPRIKG